MTNALLSPSPVMHNIHVNVVSPEEASLGVARVSWGPFLYRDAMTRFQDQLAALQV